MSDTENVVQTNVETGQPQNQQVQVTPQVQPTTQNIVLDAPTPNIVTQPVNYAGETVVETSINIFASSTGLTPEHFDNAIENALKYNDVNLINTNAFGDLKPEQVQQAKALAEAAFKETQQRIQTAVTNGIREAERLAGGAEQWQAMRSAFNTNAPAHLKAVVEQMLENHDVTNAVAFVIDTAKGLGMVNSGNQPLQGGSGNAGGSTDGTTKEQYYAEIAALEREAGNNSFEQGAYAHKYQQIQTRRNLGRQLGL